MKQKIKILQCIRQGLIGGGESHLLSLVEHLDLEQFTPVVLSFTDGPMVQRLRQMGITCHIIATQKPFDISVWRAVKKLLQTEGIDIVHAHGTRAASNILWAARSLRIPVIYTVHGWSFHPGQNALVRRIRVMGERLLTAKAQLNISVSRSNQLSGKAQFKTFRSTVINNGINLNRFNPNRLYNNVRQELGIGEKDLLVLFMARFTTQKQPLALIEAFAAALPRQPRMHLLMVGDGDEKQQAMTRIAELGLQHKITLVPFRQDVPEVLAAADVYVLPSLWEGLPIGLLEAMAMGKAVIATAVDGTSEVVQHGHNGLLVEGREMTEHLKNALLQLAADDNLRHYLQQRAIKTIGERYNAAGMTRSIEAAYQNIAASICCRSLLT